VEPRPQNPEQLNRQRTFIRALLTIPNLSVHYGHFLSHVVTMHLAPPQNGFAKVIKTEEKGSDVNLAQSAQAISQRHAEKHRYLFQIDQRSDASQMPIPCDTHR